MTKELSVVSKQFGLTSGDIRNILVAGFKSSFLTFHDRAQLVRKAQNEMDEIVRQFASGTACRRGYRVEAASLEAVHSKPRRRNAPDAG